MENHTYIIPGPIPSKKNSRKPVTVKSKKHGKPYTTFVPSNFFKKWHGLASKSLWAESRLCGVHGLKKLQGLVVCVYFPDKRKADLTNKAESVNDLLVDCGIITDDRWEVTGPVILLPGQVDKANPRARVTLYFRKNENAQI